MRSKTTCHCGGKLKKRKTAPRTAATDGLKYFDYYQCQTCKTNHAFAKDSQ